MKVTAELIIQNIHIMSETNELEQLLLKTRDELQHDFNDDAIERIETQEIQTQIKRFKISTVTPLVGEIERVAEIMKSPIHLGMLGRYSHGKTALVNALFSLPDDCRLPEGEGVVTSKVTHVCFDPDAFSPEVYERKKTGEDQQISLEELRNSVGRTGKDTSAIDFYKMILPTENMDFAKLFAQKNINLVDMPGLGGPYFNDQVQTKRYVRELDMIVAVIKMDDIYESALHLSSFIEPSGIPVIPVLTFADKWQESDLYAGCNDFGSAVLKAKDLIRDQIPGVAPYLDNIIAVSAFTGQNINELRGLILNNIETANISIAKARRDISPVYKKQLREFQTAYSQLKDKLSNASKELENILKPIVPQYSGQQKDALKDACEQTRVVRAKRALAEEANRCVNDLFLRYKDRLQQFNYVTKEADLKPAIDRFNQDINRRLIREGTERLDSCFQTYKDELLQALEKSLEKMTLDRKTIEKLREGIKDALEQRNIDSGDALGVTFEWAKVDGQIAVYNAKKAVKFFAGMAKHPETLVMLIVGIALTGVGGGLIGKAVGKVLAPVGLCLAGAGILLYLTQRGNDAKSDFGDCKDNIVSYLTGVFDSNAKKDALASAIEKEMLEINEDIKDLMSDDTSSYNADARMLSSKKENIEESITLLNNKLEDELCRIKSSGK